MKTNYTCLYVWLLGSSSDLYDFRAYAVVEDVLVISIQYRLGALGEHFQVLQVTLGAVLLGKKSLARCFGRMRVAV